MEKRTVNIHGKEYETVASRVDRFREEYGKEFGLVTEIVHCDKEVVRVRAEVRDASGSIKATGHAEEFRASSSINRNAALENCETSAIGRALAAFGIGGTEFASADELANKLTLQSNSTKGANKLQPIEESREYLVGRIEKAIGQGFLSEKEVKDLREDIKGMDVPALKATLDGLGETYKERMAQIS